MIVKNENAPKAEKIKENKNGYIYRSVTEYDYDYSHVDYVVSGNNGDEFGRFDKIEDAEKTFNTAL